MGDFLACHVCLRECSWVKVRIPWCSHKRSFWIEDLGSTATGKMSCWFWCSRFASFLQLLGYWLADTLGMFFFLKVSDWSLKKVQQSMPCNFFKATSGKKHTARWNTHWGLKSWGYGVHHKNRPKVTWENRAPKDWQVAFVSWWCRVSPIFLGLFQVIMAGIN